MNIHLRLSTSAGNAPMNAPEDADTKAATRYTAWYPGPMSFPRRTTVKTAGTVTKMPQCHQGADCQISLQKKLNIAPTTA